MSAIECAGKYGMLNRLRSVLFCSIGFCKSEADRVVIFLGWLKMFYCLGQIHSAVVEISGISK